MKFPGLLDGRRRRHFLALLANGLAQALAAIALAWLARHLFDGRSALLVPGGQAGAVAGLLLAALAIALLRRRERIDAELLGQRYVRDLRKRLFSRLLRARPDSLAQRRRGQVLVRFVGDLNAVRRWVSLGLARLGVAVVVVTVVVIALGLLHPWYALGTALTLGLMAFALWREGLRLREAVSEVRRRQGHLAANLTEKLGALTTVQLFGRARDERRRLARQQRRLIAAARERAARIGNLRAITEIGVGLAFVVSLLITVRLGAGGEATGGAFVAVFALIGFLAPPLRDIARVHEYWLGYRVARANIERMVGRIRTLSDRAADTPSGEPEGGLRFERVTVRGRLEDIEATIAPGSRIALTGPNGAGKTTLLHLVARLCEPDAGRVCIDGVPLSALPLARLREWVAYVGDDVPLLRGTLEENLCYGVEDVDPRRLEAVCEACGVDPVRERLPGGLRGRIAEGGANLSQGERARVALARALLREPRILLLDEADAHLDLFAVRAFDRVLEAFDGTVLMATHRRGAIQRADEVWRLEAGRLRARERPDRERGERATRPGGPA